MAYHQWAPYVPVAKRRAKAVREMQKLQKKGKKIEPVEIVGNKIARTFWGDGWCKHLEQFSDYSNRLPRGRTYVRNGSVCHLAVGKGKIEATVSGSQLYNIDIRITPLSTTKWQAVRTQCAGQIGSMLELLQGKFSQQVMTVVTHRDNGLFPKPNEIHLSCDCPDWATMCKHVAAVLYGVGARLDHQPELLFLLRGVDHQELISTELDMQVATTGKGKSRRITTPNISDIFGVEIEESPAEFKRPQRIKTTEDIKPVKVKKTIKIKVATTGSKALKKDDLPKKKRTAAKKKTKEIKTKSKNVTQKPFTPTAAAVRRLRKGLNLNLTQFAKLLEITPTTVVNWENSSGKLNLKSRSLDALAHVASLTPEQALKALIRLQG